MNERIKELVAQAEDYASEHEEHWHDGPDWQELFSTKFAELIVRDVAKFVGEQRNDIPACGFEFEAAIKEHFGVK